MSFRRPFWSTPTLQAGVDQATSAMSDIPNIKKPADGFVYQNQYEREGNLVKIYRSDSDGYLGTNCQAFSPVKQNIIASGSRDNTVKLWDTNTGELIAILTGHSGPVFSVAFSPDGKTLASGSQDDTVKLWDVSGKKPKEKDTLTGHSSYVLSVAFSPDGKTLASRSGDKTVKLWDVSGKEPKEKGTLGGYNKHNVISVAFSPDGKTLASGSYDKMVKLWDVSGASPREKDTLTGHSQYVYYVAFSPDNKTLASASGDKTVKLWDVSGDTHKEKATLRGHSDYVRSVAFSPDNTTLASASNDWTVKLWDVSGDTHKEKATLRGHQKEVMYVAFSPDNKTLVSVSLDKTVKLWDLSGDTPKEIKTLRQDLNNLPSVAFSPDSETLTCVSFDRKIMLWSCKNIVAGEETRKEVKLEKTIQPGFGHVRDVMISPDSHTMVSIADDKDGNLSAQFWNLSDAVEYMLIVTPKHPTDEDKVCENITFSPDLSTFACMFSKENVDKQEIIIMSIQERKPKIKRVIEPTIKISIMAFSFDNKILALVPEETTKSVQFLDWNVKDGLIMELIPAENVIFFPDNKKFVLRNVNTFTVWNRIIDVSNGQPKESQPKRMSRKDATGANVESNRIIDVSNGQESQPKEMSPKDATGANVESTVLLPDNETIAAFFDNGLLKLYQISKSGPVQDLKSYKFTCKPRFVSFSPNGNVFIHENDKEITQLLDAQTGKLIFDLGKYAAESAVFSPDGRTIALACGKYGITLIRNCDEAKMAAIAFAAVQIGHTKSGQATSLLHTPEELKRMILENLFYTPW